MPPLFAPRVRISQPSPLPLVRPDVQPLGITAFSIPTGEQHSYRPRTAPTGGSLDMRRARRPGTAVHLGSPASIMVQMRCSSPFSSTATSNGQRLADTPSKPVLCNETTMVGGRCCDSSGQCNSAMINQPMISTASPEIVPTTSSATKPRSPRTRRLPFRTARLRERLSEARERKYAVVSSPECSSQERAIRSHNLVVAGTAAISEDANGPVELSPRATLPTSVQPKGRSLIQLLESPSKGQMGSFLEESGNVQHDEKSQAMEALFDEMMIKELSVITGASIDQIMGKSHDLYKLRETYERTANKLLVAERKLFWAGRENKFRREAQQNRKEKAQLEELNASLEASVAEKQELVNLLSRQKVKAEQEKIAMERNFSEKQEAWNLEAREMRCRISSLTTAKEQLEKRCLLLQKELDSRGSELKETISQLEKDLAAVKEEKERLVCKILRDHKSEKANMKSEIERLTVVTTDLKDEVRKSRLAIHVKEDQLTTLKKRVAHLEIEVSDLVQDKANLDMQLSASLSERDTAVASASALGDHSNSLQEALANTVASEKHLQLRNQELEQLLEASQSLLGETEEQLQSLKATAAIESITSAKDILMRRNMELQRTIFERDSETQKAVEDRLMMERQVTDKEQLVKDCAYKIGEIKEDLNELRRTEAAFTKQMRN